MVTFRRKLTLLLHFGTLKEGERILDKKSLTDVSIDFFLRFLVSPYASSFGYLLKSRERKICNGMFEDRTKLVIHYAKIPLPISLYYLVQNTENSDQ